MLNYHFNLEVFSLSENLMFAVFTQEARDQFKTTGIVMVPLTSFINNPGVLSSTSIGLSS